MPRTALSSRKSTHRSWNASSPGAGFFRTRACRGAVSRRALLNAQMGLGHERFDPDLNALASDFRISESNHRQFYRSWAQLMAADRWVQAPSGNASHGFEAAP